MAICNRFREFCKRAVLAAFAVAFIFGSTGFACARSVEVMVCHPMQQHASLSAVRDGKSVNHFKLDIYDRKGKKIRSLFSDPSGTVSLPRLRRAEYMLQGREEDNAGDIVCVDLVSRNTATESSLVMTFHPLPPPEPTLTDLVSQAAESSSRQLRQLHGVIKDPSGAVVRGVAIEVFKATPRVRKPFATTKSDVAGRYAARLADGRYVIEFEAPGFHPQFVSVTINPNNHDDELLITLRLGSVT